MEHIASTAPVVFENYSMSPIHETAVGPLHGAGKSRFNRAWQQTIIRIKENDMAHSAVLQTRVARCGEAPILLANQANFGKIPDHRRRVLSRSIIYNDDLIGGARLCKDAQNGIDKKAGIIKGGNYNSDGRQLTCMLYHRTP